MAETGWAESDQIVSRDSGVRSQNYGIVTKIYTNLPTCKKYTIFCIIG